MISVSHLSKRYGTTTAVDDLTFDVQPGVVTGLLGPNGAGKSTTMRMILGLDHPTSGTTTVNGRAYRESAAPLHDVGALVEPKAIQTGRSARNHLRWLARAAGLPLRRVEETLELVGLDGVGERRVSEFSLGMCQRLGLAAALLGDAPTLILDEPTNGLDPAGIRWIRGLMADLAVEDRAVFVSSHLLGELQQTVDRVIVIDNGKLVAEASVDELASQTEQTRVRSPRTVELVRLLSDEGASVQEAQPLGPTPDSGLLVHGISASEIGDIAAAHRIPLHELTPENTSLETAFLAMTDRTPVAEARGAE